MIFNWLIFAIVFGVIEAMTFTVILVWFAIGAVIAAIAAVFTDSFYWQVFVFAASSLLLLILFMKKAKMFLVKEHTPTNADRIIGQMAKVTEDVNAFESTGKIFVIGQIWSCKTEKGEIIAKDEMVEILRIEGSKAVVRKATN